MSTIDANKRDVAVTEQCEGNSPDDVATPHRFALEQLFEALNFYRDLARQSVPPAYFGNASDRAAWLRDHQAWEQKNEAAIHAALERQREYFSLTESHAAIAGAILQLAYISIRQASACAARPSDLPDSLPTPNAAVRFCIGRKVFGLPLGLIVYAGRNQHHHMDEQLRSPNMEIVQWLSEYKVREAHPDAEALPYRDPAFDLDVFAGRSIAHNILSILGWESAASVLEDLQAAIALSSGPERTVLAQ